MKAEIIHVTDHALHRWAQRVAGGVAFTVHDIIEELRLARIISKNELMPFNTVRQPNTLYAMRRGILFVCEPLEINAFRLITVITYTENHIMRIIKTSKTKNDRPPLERKKDRLEPEVVRRKPKARVKRVCLDEYEL